MPATVHDLLIVGGGINGAGIARDAAGRRLSVLLCEQGDIGAATSSASSKLIHGGLRYLEHLEFRLVAEALGEREVLLRIAPHLTRPLRFVMPHVPTLRAAWMIRLGLVLYDSLGRIGRHATLPRSRAVDLSRSPFGAALQDRYGKGYVYSDVAVDDARLTLINARAAADLGAAILTRTRFVAAVRDGDAWRATLEDVGSGERREIRAHALVNAAGPWVAEVLAGLPARQRAGVQLVKGSHIVVRKLYEGEHAYILQNDDRRVVFLLPFEQDYTLIGTTEQRVARPEATAVSADEIDYLCRSASSFSRLQVTPADVVWSYSGVRPLADDGKQNPSAVTRDYSFVLDSEDQAPALSIFGGKLTTYRKLAEAALARLAPRFPHMGRPWTDSEPLPGGDFTSFADLLAGLQRRYPDLPAAWLKPLARRHGSLTHKLIGNAKSIGQLGRHFGGGLYEREVEYLIACEWAKNADDILWRRTKAGLRMSAEQRAQFADWLAGRPA